MSQNKTDASALFTAAHKLTKATIRPGDDYRVTFTAALAIVRREATQAAAVDWESVPVLNKVPDVCDCPSCGTVAAGVVAIRAEFGVRRMKRTTKTQGPHIVVRAQSYCRGCRS